MAYCLRSSKSDTVCNLEGDDTMTSAVLVIDLQNALVEQGYRADSLLETVRSLLDRARSDNVPVIYLRMEHTEGEGPLVYGTAGWEIHPCVAPREGDIVLDKRNPDSFYQTALGDELRARGVTRLIITGMATEQCVDVTARSAHVRGYDVIVVADGHTMGGDYPGALPVAQRIAYHNMLLAHIANPEHAITVVPAAEVDFATGERA
jgi:isochorismate hydrolase